LSASLSLSSLIIYTLTEAVLADLNITRHKWENAQLKFIPRSSDNEEIAIGIQHAEHTLKSELKALKAVFFDLGDTLVKYDDVKG
jgi:hypothetical protein